MSKISAILGTNKNLKNISRPSSNKDVKHPSTSNEKDDFFNYDDIDIPSWSEIVNNSYDSQIEKTEPQAMHDVHAQILPPMSPSRTMAITSTIKPILVGFHYKDRKKWKKKLSIFFGFVIFACKKKTIVDSEHDVAIPVTLLHFFSQTGDSYQHPNLTGSSPHEMQSHVIFDHPWKAESQ